VIVTGMAVIGLGAGAVGTVATDLVVATAPAPRAGAASAISETSAELGGALGIAVLGSIGTAIYRNELATAIPPDLPAAAAQNARETLGGATEAADTLPAPLSTQLLDAAHGAFAHGLELAALITAATVLALALLAAVLLQRLPQGSGSWSDAET
jgi:DHA2 family multidrug resistance protein-like MFS transporter